MNDETSETAARAGFRALSVEGMVAFARGHDPGPPPALAWVSLCDCLIDESYQRPITRQGVTNVRRIAAEFNWSRFAPLIVAPTPDGRWAIIDGQHRATAALLLGYERAPAMVATIPPGEQAAAFAAVNGNVTRPHGLGIFAAAVASGDEAAVALSDAARAAGVTVMKYPRERSRMNINETLAIGALKSMFKRWGGAALTLGLSCLTMTRHNRIGVINHYTVQAATNALGPRKDWIARPGAVIAAMDRFDAAELRDWIESCTSKMECAALSEALSAHLAAELAPARKAVR